MIRVKLQAHFEFSNNFFTETFQRWNTRIKTQLVGTSYSSRLYTNINKGLSTTVGRFVLNLTEISCDEYCTVFYIVMSSSPLSPMKSSNIDTLGG